MKILILNWRDTKNPRTGGAEIVTLEHVRGWVNAGHEVIWLNVRLAGQQRSADRKIISE
jgi:hypothetical protein